MDDAKQRDAVRTIFAAALQRANPYRMVTQALLYNESTKCIELTHVPRRSDGGEVPRPSAYKLSGIRGIAVFAIGKAAMPMTQALATFLAELPVRRPIDEAVVVVPDGSLSAARTSQPPLSHNITTLQLIGAGHPIPNQHSHAAALAIWELVERANRTPDILVIGLISGGGSALCCAPFGSLPGQQLEPKDTRHAAVSLTLEDTQRATDVLLASGATIQEQNCVRRHLSGIKGGRLIERLERQTPGMQTPGMQTPGMQTPGMQTQAPNWFTLILSDVVDAGDYADEVATIASGPTAPDNSTFADALAIIERYTLHRDMPPHALAVLQAGAAGRIPETLKDASGFAHNYIVGNNYQAVCAGRETATQMGYHCVPLRSYPAEIRIQICQTGFPIGEAPYPLVDEARDAARMLANIVLWACNKKEFYPEGIGRQTVVVVTGGETTVTLSDLARGDTIGTGGRNQELALAFLCEMPKIEYEYRKMYGGTRSCRITLLSAASDGRDGPTDAAGAFASFEISANGQSANGQSANGQSAKTRYNGLNSQRYLERHDAYTFFDTIGGLFRTGPTGTNVGDLQMIIIE